MRLILAVLLLTLLTTSAKKKKHNVKQSASSESDDNISDEEILSTKSPGISLSGNLRKKFAIEAAIMTQSNMVCSPLSALLPLGKLAFGATGGSKKELLKAIGTSSTTKLKSRFKPIISALRHLPGVTLTVASRIFINFKYNLQKDFKVLTKDVFGSTCEKINLESPTEGAKVINAWVESETRGMVRNMLSPSLLQPGTPIVIVNAIYFQGQWVKPFKDTKIGDFFTSSGSQKVPMMTQDGYYNYVHSRTLDAEILELPYKEKKCSFVIVLPKAKDGLPELLRALKLAPDLLDKALRNMVIKNVQVTIPRFKVMKELDLREIYRKIDVNKIFTRESGLTKMMEPDQNIMVGAAIQKAVIEVSETGTTASVASGAIASKMAAPDMVFFIANRGFLFYVMADREQIFTGTFISAWE